MCVHVFVPSVFQNLNKFRYAIVLFGLQRYFVLRTYLYFLNLLPNSLFLLTFF